MTCLINSFLQVEIFVNRALKHTQSFYCMVNCHLLNTSACQYIETRLSEREDNDKSDYGLVFLYDEDESKCRIRSSLKKDLIKKYNIKSTSSLEKMVEKLLKVVDYENPVTAVDPKGLVKIKIML